MNVYKIKSIYLLFLLGMLTAVSCETTEETFEKFTKDGEQIIVGKPISIDIKPGNLRAVFVLALNADPKIKKGTIEWTRSDGAQAIHEFNIVKTGFDNETIEVEVPNVEEGNRTFTITLLDDNGHKSIPEEKSKVIFGGIYQSNLLPRVVTAIVTKANGTAEITFDDVKVEGLYKTIIRYEDGEGVVQEFELENHINTVMLDSFNGNVQLEVYSIFKPTENAIDTFTSISNEFTFPRVIIPLDLSAAIGLDLNGDIAFNSNTWDNNPATYTVQQNLPFPLTFSVDLGLSEAYELEEITWFSFTPFPNINTKEYQLWGASDIADADTTIDITVDRPGWEAEMEAKGWVKLIEDKFNINYSSSASHKIINETKVKFLRIVVLDHFDLRPGNLDFAWGGINFKAYLP